MISYLLGVCLPYSEAFEDNGVVADIDEEEVEDEDAAATADVAEDVADVVLLTVPDDVAAAV